MNRSSCNAVATSAAGDTLVHDLVAKKIARLGAKLCMLRGEVVASLQDPVMSTFEIK